MWRNSARIMDAAAWEDGRSTAGAQSALVKKNEQLPPDGEMARKLGESHHLGLSCQSAVHFGRDPAADLSAAVQPLRRGGQHFGIHVDNAVRGDHLTGARIRTDLSVTLFLSEPEEYDGGELVVEDDYGSHASSCRPAIWCFILRRACTWSRRSREACGLRRSSGCRA